LLQFSGRAVIFGRIETNGRFGFAAGFGDWGKNAGCLESARYVLRAKSAP